MKKLKLLWEKLLNNFKDVFSKFPITMIIILAVTVMSAICFDGFIIEEEILADIVVIGAIWSVGTLFAEIYLKDKKIFKYIVVGITFLIAIFFNEYLGSDKLLFGWEAEKTETILSEVFISYMVTLISLMIYKLSKQSGLDIKEYIFKVCSENFATGIIYIVLNIGISAVTAIFIYLILNGEHYDFIIRMLILALGVFYIPSVISIFVNAEKIKLNNFIEKLILYVIFPLTMVAILIIYIYLAKILILMDIPKNTIGRILIAIYCVALPVWAMVLSIKKENFIKVAQKIPYIYLPLMLLEIYSILIRIINNGFTPARYACILFIIFQLISFYIIIVKKEKYLRQLILIGLMLFLTYAISPINYRFVSNVSQKNILDEYVENGIKFDECSKKDQKRYKGAYQYLQYEYDSEKYINKKLTDEDKEKLREYTYYREMENIHERIDINELDVSGYKKVYFFDFYESFEYSNKELNTEKLKIETSIGEKEINLKKYIDTIINQKELVGDIEEFFKDNNEIYINSNQKICLQYFGLSYDKETREIDYISIDGYILEK